MFVSSSSVQRTALLLVGVLCMTMLPPARAILFYDTANSTHNNSAPTGPYANSGWQYEGYFGSFLGTMIAPTLFLTAQHIGVSSSNFVYSSTFSGVATQTFAINTSANGGVGYFDIAGTDLRIYQITGGTFPIYAPIYSGAADVGSGFVVTGRGGPRGAAVNLAPDGLKGWLTGGSDGVARWGRNTFDTAVSSSVGSLLVADFDAISSQDEAHLSVGDSGGGSFIFQGGQWQLAGINYAVEGYWDTNNVTGDNSHFGAALFDKGGFYLGSDAGGWTLQTDTVTNKPSKLYISRLSDSSAAINNVINLVNVPEAGSALLILSAGILLLMRRRSFLR
jgi:hypothetical protein